MKLFKCQHCGQILYFENSKRERCDHQLGYLPAAFVLRAIEPDGQAWRPIGDGKAYRFCANAALGACNWLLDADSPDSYCACCRHNRTVPDLGDAGRLAAWRKIEAAKHRLFYSLLRLGLPVEDNAAPPVRHLAFDSSPTRLDPARSR